MLVCIITLLVIAINGPIESPKVIPLNTIWAWQMPGTNDVRALEPNHFGKAVRKLPQNQQTALLLGSLKHQIDMAIRSRTKSQRPIGPGFVVPNKEKAALVAICEKLRKADSIAPSIASTSEATLFFYGSLNGQYLHLKDVTRTKNQILVNFQFVPHITMEMTQHFALIPLGILPAGKYTVIMKHMPLTAKANRTSTVKGTSDYLKLRKEKVCRDFSFTVVERLSSQ